MNKQLQAPLRVTAAAIVMVFAASFLPAATVEASRPNANGEHKITICHATSAVKNPYVRITVDHDAADGGLGNDHGKGDHYNEHTGPVFNQSTDKNGGNWGDIIPPLDGVHAGRNWTAQGQAIYNNGCNVPAPVTTPPVTPPVAPSGSVLSTTTTTPSQAQTPKVSAAPVLADTGVNPIVSVVVGLAAMITAVGTALLSRKQSV